MTLKSEAISPCKKVPVILVNKVLDKERIVGKRGLRRRRGTRGR
jgi:hypothetical protein